MNASQFLTHAKNLISDPMDWGQGALETHEPDTGKTRYCAEGAQLKATELCPGIHVAQLTIAYVCLDKAAAELMIEHGLEPECDLAFAVTVNDHLDHAAVMEMYDRAISYATEAQEMTNEALALDQEDTDA